MNNFNRHNLTGEDAAAIILILAGVAIIATIFFWSMPSQTRNDVVTVVNPDFYQNLILQAVDDTVLVINSVPLFLQEFNSEFTRVAEFDVQNEIERISVAIHDTGKQVFALADYIGQGYAQLHSSDKKTYGQLAIQQVGKIMGASIDLEEEMRASGMRMEKVKSYR
jgi:hypothetical protein